MQIVDWSSQSNKKKSITFIKNVRKNHIPCWRQFNWILTIINANSFRWYSSKFHQEGWKKEHNCSEDIKLHLRNTIHELLWYENIHRETCVQGPSHAMLAANNEPKSCPSVAPAPIKPNNLEPDWIERTKKSWNERKETTKNYPYLVVHCNCNDTSLSMTSITLAQVDDIVMRLSKATFRWRELFELNQLQYPKHKQDNSN